ncbi:MAG: polysaccharide export protein [Novosphingobium sp.]|nr:polysaccharide export protein [Novosphingobium sp.]
MWDLIGQRWRSSALACAALCSLSACAGLPPPVAGPVEQSPVGALGQADFTATPADTYPLHRNDVLSVTVFREPDLSTDSIAVGGDGAIALPLIGSVTAEGLTTDQLAQSIAGKLRGGGLKHPDVAVNIVDYASHVVTVEGAVEKPGIYQFKPGTRLSGALALATGPARVAKLSQVAVFRNVPGGIEVAKFDYAQISQGKMVDPLMQPGDRVVMGLSSLSQFWQDLLTALPAFAIFTRI